MTWRTFAAGWRRTAALASLGLVAGCAGSAVAEDRVRVLYPAGACDSGTIEIEVFDRSSGQWQKHPEHWRVPVGSCQDELAGLLLQEIRYRCVDPDIPARSSEWHVGVDVFDPVDSDLCKTPETK